MDLFSDHEQPLINLLPYDGVAEYHGVVLSPKDASHYLDALLTEIDWQADEAIIMGKRIETRRKVAWHADQAFKYTYSKVTKTAKSWTPVLLFLKAMVEKETGETFNACLLNLYNDGADGMAWHSDAEKDLKKEGAIASLSLGAERKFSFKHKVTKETRSVELQHGSLLVMKGTTQSHWLHRLPPTKKCADLRVNLTFRTIVSEKMFLLI